MSKDTFTVVHTRLVTTIYAVPATSKEEAEELWRDDPKRFPVLGFTSESHNVEVML